jgi:putative oxidoreductase
MLKRILSLSFVPSSTDAGLLALRVCAFISLFLKHGYEKVFTFSQMASHFRDVLHFGATGSLIMAMFSDSICSLLIVVGLATRLAAFYSFLLIFIAWSVVHRFMFFGHGADHGEVMWLYLSALITIFIAGPGRYSLDYLLNKEGVFNREPVLQN